MGFEAYLTHIPLTYLVLIAGSYDLAHAVYPTDALAAVRWGRRTGRPSLLSYMGIPTDRWLRSHRLRRKVLLRAVHGSDAVVALSRHAAEAFHQSVDHDPEVIPPGVDLRAFRPLAARAERPTVVCSAAADVPRKNVGLLVGAFELVRAERPDARLVLSNPRDPQAVRHAGVDLRAGGIEWATLDDRDTLARAYGEAWVAVLPSMDEAFGLVLVEALACGTPVVGYAHGGIPEVIDRPQIGELFSSMDAGGLARALLDALELAPDPRTATYCRARAEELSAERCVDSYVALYRKLLASSS
jgi:glycosyltransferase involved in cell wall biosynthesis